MTTTVERDSAAQDSANDESVRSQPTGETANGKSAIDAMASDSSSSNSSSSNSSATLDESLKPDTLVRLELVRDAKLGAKVKSFPHPDARKLLAIAKKNGASPMARLNVTAKEPPSSNCLEDSMQGSKNQDDRKSQGKDEQVPGRGLAQQEIDGRTAGADKLEELFIVLITSVSAGGLAHECGLQKYDQLIMIDDTPVETYASYKHVLAKLRDERPLELTFLRKDGPPPALRNFDDKSELGTATTSGPAGTDTFVMVSSKSRQEQILERHVDALESGSLDIIRHVSFHGLAEKYRPVYWRVLLGYLPPDINEWAGTLQRKRALYEEYKREFGRMGREKAGSINTAHASGSGSQHASGFARNLEEKAHVSTTRPSRLRGQGWWELGAQDIKSSCSPRQGNPSSPSTPAQVSSPTIVPHVDDLARTEVAPELTSDASNSSEANLPLATTEANLDDTLGKDSMVSLMNKKSSSSSSNSKSIIAADNTHDETGDTGDAEVEDADDHPLSTSPSSAKHVGASAQKQNSDGDPFQEEQGNPLHSQDVKLGVASSGLESKFASSTPSVGESGFVEDEEDEDLRETIWKDAQRTHPGFHFFAEARCEVMERILFIYAKLNPAIKYVQGMNELVAPIMFTFGTTSLDYTEETRSELGRREAHLRLDRFKFEENYEADAFFCFCSVMGDMRDLYMQGMDVDQDGIRGRGQLLMESLHRVDPAVALHLEALEINPQFFAFRWITTLLSRELPLPDTVRLWDSLFADDKRFSFLIDCCCAMLHMQRDALLGSDFAGTLQILQKYPVTDVNDILSVAAKIKAGALRVEPAQVGLKAVMKSVVPNMSSTFSLLKRSLKGQWESS
mmetsp:Transcript_4725/g.8029  ORF Transcript_4725/g.8029 Transcript_4725/m.8029 type:complete len:850 (-) Transcript_4725:1298-3847(-)|eukprot:CAMPEP_0171552466 /NCGR_PEP_ID=MMETSP0960-20121227/8346_1 /TAXON_ID=87120 /ORGANISM="Aurantiochytrium limacinum, Strain ATCCMYA-1381" /LENGTH=849 /DNA_ID=CAMNT_0012101937 /DNA_START=89 /DNA_END=2638 /DNA_ORIENTATION=+